MSRLKKSRSLKRVTGGVKTGSKERTKLESKQRKAKKKADNPRKSNRQRSVYQKFLDDNNMVEKQHVQKPATQSEEVQEDLVIEAEAQSEYVSSPLTDTKDSADAKAKDSDKDLWSQLENPNQNDTF